MDIRLFTSLIVRREDGAFLVGRIVFSNELRWSDSPFDAWRTRRIPDAEKVARKVGGKLWLFNPVSARLRPFMGMNR